MLGRRQFLAVCAAVILVSVIGGWIWSAASDTDPSEPALTLVTAVDNQTIPTNAPNEGRALPDVDLYNADGDAISTSALYATPLIINFWFSTCEPCRREMPVLQNAHLEWGDRVEFIGVNPQDNPADAEKFAAKYGIDYPLLLDRDGALVGKVGVSTFPTTLFVDTNGQVVLQYAGELTEDELAASIKEAFNFQ